MTGDFKKLIIGVLVVLVLVGLSLLALWPSKPPEIALPGAGGKTTPPQLSASRTELHGTAGGGKLEWNASCDKISGGLKSDTLEAEHIDFTLKRGEQVVLQLKAPSLVFDRKERTLTLKGGLQAQSDLRAMTLQVGALVLDFQHDRLKGSGGVELRRGKLGVRAERLEADLELGKISLLGSARVAWVKP